MSDRDATATHSFSRAAPWKTTENMKPDAFSPRVFHQKDMEFDEFVDFESWIYTVRRDGSRHENVSLLSSDDLSLLKTGTSVDD